MPAASALSRLRHQPRLLLIDAAVLLLSPLLPLALALRWWKRGQGLPGLREKIVGPRPSPSSPGGVVVHGVSLGEVGLMRLLLPAISERWQCHCLLTTSTSTGRAALDKQWPDHQRHWLPFDLPWAVERFLNHTKPRALVLLELELWPRLLAACHRRGIPVYLLNARVSARSYAGYRRVRRLLRPLLAPLRLAVAQNPLWGARLRALGVERVAVGGSLKADLVRLASKQQQEDLRQRLQLSPQAPVLVLASTSDGEELPCVAAWRQACPHHHLIIVPRHPERGPRIAAELQQQGLPVWLWSRDGQRPPQTEDIRIIDTIGQLSAVYALASIAIVGGSLGSGRHGQNMLEAAAHHCATMVGPDTSNFPDAMALLREAQAIIETPVAQLPQSLATLVADPERQQALATAGHRAWAQACGATQRSIALLAQAPPPASKEPL